MLFNELRRFITWLTQSPLKSLSDQPEPVEATPSALEFDPMWHGDHWQNLLSSPMDARRYVMEDWSVSRMVDWSDVDGPLPAH
ncbi:MAG TPA: hypothetical protein VEN30_07175 [Paraburkholderia sp.]|nr:hypothetical protein [Paraburkholderia sp.]